MRNFNKLILLLLILSISLLGEQIKDPYSGITLPNKLGDFDRTKIIDNEKSNPGLGTTVLYNTRGVKASIYIYNMERKFITDGINSPYIKKGFLQAQSDIRRAADLGYYEIASKINTTSTFLNKKTSSVPVLKAEFTLTNNKNKSTSILYLTATNNHLFKIRISYATSDQKYVQSIIETFLTKVAKLINSSYTEWNVVNTFGKSKVYANKNYIERKGNFISTIVIYSLDPSGTDKTNGKPVSEMLMLEEYDVVKDQFRIQSIQFIYDDATVSKPMGSGLKWKPATGGNQSTLDFLKSTIKK